MKRQRGAAPSQRHGSIKRDQATRQMILRLLMLGWSQERIAKKLHRSARQVRYIESRPSFVAEFEALQREYFRGVDQQMRRLLKSANLTIKRLMKHKDWRARAWAVEQTMRVHGRYLDRLDLTGSLTHTVEGQVDHRHAHVVGYIPPEQMTPEVSTKVRELLALTRPKPPGNDKLLGMNGNGHDEDKPR